MGIIGQKWNKRIMPERLNIGTDEKNRTVLIHWTKQIENGKPVYIGKVR